MEQFEVTLHDQTDLAVLISGNGMMGSAQWVPRSRIKIIGGSQKTLIVEMTTALAHYLKIKRKNT